MSRSESFLSPPPSRASNDSTASTTRLKDQGGWWPHSVSLTSANSLRITCLHCFPMADQPSQSSSTVLGRRLREDALQLGPRKKVSVVELLYASILCTNTKQMPFRPIGPSWSAFWKNGSCFVQYPIDYFEWSPSQWRPCR